MRSSFPFEAILYPFGFPVIVASHSELAVEVARAEWAVWQQAFDDFPIELRLHVVQNKDYSGPPTSTFQTTKDRFSIVTDQYNMAIGDTRGRSAWAMVQERVVDDRPYFVYHYLDAMAFQLITSLNFTPMHGATVAQNGRGLLITGDSGEGKSSLSYACARQGWTFVSDDASHLLRRCASERIIVGAPHHVRLRPDARQLFPELATFEPKMRGNGKLSLQIPTRQLSIETAPSMPVDSIVLPRRVSGGHASAPARLDRIGKHLVRDYCAQWFYHWDGPILAEQQTAFEELLKGVSTYSLEYSDLDAAVKVLDEVV